MVEVEFPTPLSALVRRVLQSKRDGRVFPMSLVTGTG